MVVDGRAQDIRDIQTRIRILLLSAVGRKLNGRFVRSAPNTGQSPYGPEAARQQSALISLKKSLLERFDSDG